mmetsp:Transcript_4770/g.12193  ORF Transcript_4770/g.12193 Transcript_4770/m.12193 type:complete len:283 (+) Transcript_4770:468-1316(+)
MPRPSRPTAPCSRASPSSPARTPSSTPSLATCATLSARTRSSDSCSATFSSLSSRTAVKALRGSRFALLLHRSCRSFHILPQGTVSRVARHTHRLAGRLAVTSTGTHPVALAGPSPDWLSPWVSSSLAFWPLAQRKLVTPDSTRPFVSGRVCGRRRPSPLSRCQHSFLPGTRAPSPRVSMEHLLHFSVHYTSASHHSTSRRASPPTTLISAFLVPPITGLLQPHRGSHSLPRGTGQQADSLFFGGRAAQFYSSCCTAPPPSVRIARLLPTLSCNFRVPGPSP